MGYILEKKPAYKKYIYIPRNIETPLSFPLLQSCLHAGEDLTSSHLPNIIPTCSLPSSAPPPPPLPSCLFGLGRSRLEAAEEEREENLWPIFLICDPRGQQKGFHTPSDGNLISQAWNAGKHVFSRFPINIAHFNLEELLQLKPPRKFFVLFQSSMELLLTFLFPTKQEQTTERPAGWT